MSRGASRVRDAVAVACLRTEHPHSLKETEADEHDDMANDDADGSAGESQSR